MSKLTPKTTTQLRARRHARVRGRINGTESRPRLAVFRSNKALYAQLIDDMKGVTIASATSQGMTGKTMLEQAVLVGEQVANAALAKNIDAVVFDRGGFTYAGRIKALADAARARGLKF